MSNRRRFGRKRVTGCECDYRFTCRKCLDAAKAWDEPRALTGEAEMPKSFTLDGKRYRLDPVVPTGFIKWRMEQVHIATSDETITKEFTERCTKNAIHDERLIAQVCLYALKCHRDNQELYSYVARGK